jgi:hypothetical protein
MPNIPAFTNFIAGNIIDAASMNANFDIIETFLNVTKIDDSNIQDSSISASKLISVPAPSIVTTLPGSPSDGDAVAFQNASMATDGIVWVLRYRAASPSAHKWEFIGGSPMTHEQSTTETINSAHPTYTAAPTPGALLTAPLDGDYAIRWGAELYFNGVLAGSQRDIYAAVKIGTNPVSDADAIRVSHDDREEMYQERTKKFNISSGEVVEMRYADTSAGFTITADKRYMEMIPGRVG